MTELTISVAFLSAKAKIYAFTPTGQLERISRTMLTSGAKPKR